MHAIELPPGRLAFAQVVTPRKTGSRPDQGSAQLWRGLSRTPARESIDRRRIVNTETEEPSSKCRRNFAITCSRGLRSSWSTADRGDCQISWADLRAGPA